MLKTLKKKMDSFLYLEPILGPTLHLTHKDIGLKRLNLLGGGNKYEL